MPLCYCTRRHLCTLSPSLANFWLAAAHQLCTEEEERLKMRSAHLVTLHLLAPEGFDLIFECYQYPSTVVALQSFCCGIHIDLWKGQRMSSHRQHCSSSPFIPVPRWLEDVMKDIVARTDMFPAPLNHVLINEYLPGQGIMVSFQDSSLASVHSVPIHGTQYSFAEVTAVCSGPCSVLRL